MGTRSLTTIMEEDKKLTTIYRQFDGYPDGHGLELAEFLDNGRIVNGIPVGGTERLFNGMGCLAAQLIAQLKDGVGNIYVYPADASDCWEEYHYYISNNNGTPHIKCYELYNNQLIFEGSPKEFINEYKGE